MAMLLGHKLGMTRVYTDGGVSVPVTAIRLGPCVVTQLRTPEVDGYAAVQIGFGEKNPRRSSRPLVAHDLKAGVGPRAHHAEFLVDASEVQGYGLGQELAVDGLFSGHAFVDVTGVSKGKGFQGVMKRHNFAGLEASHGVERKHRSAGSIGGGGINLGTGPKLKKGKRMAGHMGAVRSTVRSLEVIRIVPEENLLLVKGAVPGPNKGLVRVVPASRLYKPKARKQRELQAG